MWLFVCTGTRRGLLGSAPSLSKTAGSSNLWICRRQPISLKEKGKAVQPGGCRGSRWGWGGRAPTCHSHVVLHEPDVALGLRGEVLPLPGARGVRFPARERFVLHLHLLQNLLVGCGHGAGVEPSDVSLATGPGPPTPVCLLCCGKPVLDPNRAPSTGGQAPLDMDSQSTAGTSSGDPAGKLHGVSDPKGLEVLKNLCPLPGQGPHLAGQPPLIVRRG